MKVPILFFTALLAVYGSLTAQQNTRKPSLLSYHVSFSDYELPGDIKRSSLSDALARDTWYLPGRKSFGLGINWWKGLTRHIDFSAGLTGTFSNFPAGFVKDDSIGQAGFSTQADLLLHARLFSEKAAVNPFLTAGLGAGYFPGRFAVYAPLGTGLQFRFREGAYLLLQAQWRMRLTEGISNDYLHYSIGFAQHLARQRKPAKEKEPAVIPVLPPDRDGDGFDDNNDECPDAKGTVRGCPDTDGDGVPDKDDQCPGVKGTLNGCPDNDGDGVADKDDKCPDVAGLARYQGCPIPDSDGDGINDEADKCPNLPGTAANQGCPDIQPQVKKQVDLAARNIRFKFASDELLPESLKLLYQVAGILIENPDLKLTIEAHADNRGLSERNLMWSERRAKAVADYFISKGIAPERLTFKGYGDTQPVADNATEAGRAQNRRVEMKLFY
ncbi:MAG TPA: OmpA family protein [Lacibacter sp.]|nr:OmpA family protein [Lacibacter sp.]HMO90357.1 OmpA family protein [Lacibacter sp.]